MHLPKNYEMHIHMHLHMALFHLIEYATYINHVAFSELIINKIYLSISNLQAPFDLATIIINGAPKKYK